jgi:altronate dehydratase small subunit
VSAVKANVVVINPADNVAVALTDIGKGEKIVLPGGLELEAVNDIPFSHKIALFDLVSGEQIIKYGEIIGQAKEDIVKGDWVHIHNLTVEDEGGEAG